MGVKAIPLTMDKFAVVDDEDFEKLNRYKWRALKRILKNRVNYYAVRTECCGKNRYMHREILGVVDTKIEVDHKDSNGLNNQKTNIRPANHRENQQHSTKQPNCSSRFKGVSLHRGKWKVQIKPPNRPQIYIGMFDDEHIAASVYNAAAKRYFKEFALTNPV
jgi:hypothetical protein